jgi:hypothetical protein
MKKMAMIVVYAEHVRVWYIGAPLVTQKNPFLNYFHLSIMLFLMSFEIT